MLAPLVWRMTRPEPAARPSAQEALELFREIQKDVWTVRRLWRAHLRDEPLSAKAIFDALSLVGLHPSYCLNDTHYDDTTTVFHGIQINFLASVTCKLDLHLSCKLDLHLSVSSHFPLSHLVVTPCTCIL